MRLRDADIRQFCRDIETYFAEYGRAHLPWRHTRDPYKILVSEMMLQQTQVDRVIPKFEQFIEAFPTVESLAQAKLSDVFLLWKGLGYNRRAKFLRDACLAVVSDHNGIMPNTHDALLTLPGVGPYTARAVYVFSGHGNTYVIETNVRSVVIARFFPRARNKVSDTQIASVLERCVPYVENWYAFNAGLMDYGSTLKKVKNHARNAKVYTKQKKFKGSVREVRGALLRILHEGPVNEKVLEERFAEDIDRFTKARDGLLKDGLIVIEHGKITLAS